MFERRNNKAPKSQERATDLKISESIFPIKHLYQLTSIKIQEYISAFAYFDSGSVYFGRGILVWSSGFRPRCDEVVRWEGSTSLSKSLSF